MKKISFNNFRFRCNRCGNCCHKVRVKKQIPVPSYDYTGRFKFNPYVSVVVNYQERLGIEVFIKNNTKFRVNIKPMEVFFLKLFQVGFIREYQIGIEDQHCYYYDIKNKRCKIYSHRPAVCRYYPLQLANQKFHIPKPNNECLLIKNLLEDQYNVKKKEKILYDLKYEHLKIAFHREYKIYLETRAEWFIQSKYFLEFFEDLLIPSDELSPKRIKDHKLKDMCYFIEWAEENFKTPSMISLLEEFKENYYIIAKKALKKRYF